MQIFINPVFLNKIKKMEDPQIKRYGKNYDLEFISFLNQPISLPIRCQRASSCSYKGYSINCNDVNGNQHCNPEGVGAKKNTGYIPKSIDF